MFNKHITASEEFLDMPSSTQALYFHLGMFADDDGIVQPHSVMRTVRASDDDLKVLLAKNFVIGFDAERVVVITHWKINNWIQKDRYRPSLHKDIVSRLEIDENGAYLPCIQNVYIGKDRIGKDRIGYYSRCAAFPEWKSAILQHFQELYVAAHGTPYTLIASDYMCLAKRKEIALDDMIRVIDNWFSDDWGKKVGHGFKKMLENDCFNKLLAKKNGAKPAHHTIGIDDRYNKGF